MVGSWCNSFILVTSMLLIELLTNRSLIWGEKTKLKPATVFWRTIYRKQSVILDYFFSTKINSVLRELNIFRVSSVNIHICIRLFYSYINVHIKIEVSWAVLTYRKHGLYLSCQSKLQYLWFSDLYKNWD